jgi:hypothetical protein
VEIKKLLCICRSVILPNTVKAKEVELDEEEEQFELS